MDRVRSFQVCSRCRNHGIKSILKGHKKDCSFKRCQCKKCLVTKDRQSYIAREIAMHRYEIKKSGDFTDAGNGLKVIFERSRSKDVQPMLQTRKHLRQSKSSGEVRKNQKCSRCRNHGTSQLLRGHKNECPYAACDCERCNITKMRRQIMARQIKNYRNETSDAVPEIILEEDVKQFVDYEPVQDRDLFFMVQSLFEKYVNQNAEKKIQFIYAFTQLAKGNWNDMEMALAKGSHYAEKYSVQHNLFAYENKSDMMSLFLSSASTNMTATEKILSLD